VPWLRYRRHGLLGGDEESSLSDRWGRISSLGQNLIAGAESHRFSSPVRRGKYRAQCEARQQKRFIYLGESTNARCHRNGRTGSEGHESGRIPPQSRPLLIGTARACEGRILILRLPHPATHQRTSVSLHRKSRREQDAKRKKLCRRAKLDFLDHLNLPSPWF
jgi:hypothetical protein